MRTIVYADRDDPPLEKSSAVSIVTAAACADRPGARRGDRHHHEHMSTDGLHHGLL
jgi:hypothetical protein